MPSQSDTLLWFACSGSVVATVPPMDVSSGKGAAAIARDVVLAYENLSAALWAGEALERLAHAHPVGVTLRVSPWSFAALEHPRSRAVATNEFVNADVVAIASRAASRLLSATVECWLRGALSRRRNRRFVLAAFFGFDDHPACADSPRTGALQRLAQEAGCAFYSAQVEEETACII